MKGTIIARGGLPLRETPKTGAVIRSLRRNSSVEILEKETWLRVRTREGKQGFVLADFVETAPEDLFPPARPSSARARRSTRSRGAAVRTASVGTATSVAESIAAHPLSEICDIRIYRNTRFIGAELLADIDFFPSLDLLNQFATACGLEILVTSSTREPGRKVDGAIVKPATRSNHLVGHAIDVNLKSGNRLFNSKALKRSNLPNLPSEIREFIGRVRADGTLRWGGDFSAEDPVHIDDNLNGREPAIWDHKLASRG
jgi:D-alanyl-D-alanine carboxypeptidase/Bacterial SH3 domain